VKQQSRRVLKGIVGKLASKEAAKTAAKRTVLRVFAPIVAIPISAGLSWRGAHSVLSHASAAMRRRGAVVGPLVHLFAQAPEYPRAEVLRAFAAVADATGAKWSTLQHDALRHSRNALSILDEDHVTVAQGDRAHADAIVGALPTLPPSAGCAFVEYLSLAAAFADSEGHTARASQTAIIDAIASRVGAPAVDTKRIDDARMRLQ
jgi:hypothetical protein